MSNPQYRVLHITSYKPEEIARLINQVAQEGWRIVDVRVIGDYMQVIFERYEEPVLLEAATIDFGSFEGIESRLADLVELAKKIVSVQAPEQGGEKRSGSRTRTSARS